MTRYIKQLDSYSCGVIAYLNIMNYFGSRYNRTDLPKYRKLLKTDKEYGTEPLPILALLRENDLLVGSRSFGYNPNKLYLACYISNSSGTMHYIVILPGRIAINWHPYNDDTKMYTRYELPKRWIMDRVGRNTIYLWNISQRKPK